LARPLTELTKKGVAFKWTEKHTSALDHLIQLVMMAPVLDCLDPKKQYFLEVDALVFALGAVLFQHDEQGRR